MRVLRLNLVLFLESFFWYCLVTFINVQKLTDIDETKTFGRKMLVKRYL